jgi:hypothetical protein
MTTGDYDLRAVIARVQEAIRVNPDEAPARWVEESEDFGALLSSLGIEGAAVALGSDGEPTWYPDAKALDVRALRGSVIVVGLEGNWTLTPKPGEPALWQFTLLKST